MNRTEHMQWVRDRALEYADQGEVGAALSSVVQDLALHPETKDHTAADGQLAMMLAMAGEFERPGELRKFIEGIQ